MTVESDTLNAVDGHWRTARDIHLRVGCWGFTSVRHALTELEQREVVEGKYAAHRNGEVIEYRLRRPSP